MNGILDEEMRLQAKREIESIGAYQVTMYLIIGVPLILSAAYSMGYAFTAGEVDYRYLQRHFQIFVVFLSPLLPPLNNRVNKTIK